MKILAISGSLRSGSHNTDLLRGAAAGAPDGVDIELYHGLKEIPPYDADDDVPGDPPEPVARFKAALAEADAILISTPEYNSSIPGVLKNAVDWVSRPLKTNPLRNKPAAVIGASTGMFGAVWAQEELRKVLGAVGARVVEGEVAVGHAADRFEPDGALNDDDIRDQLRELARLLAHELAPQAIAA
jgi:chromate reductase, NAD(P)H dehydrogenase (quinone)